MLGLKPKQFSKQVDMVMAKADSILVDIRLMQSYLRAHSPAPIPGQTSERGGAAVRGTGIHYSAPCPAGDGAEPSPFRYPPYGVRSGQPAGRAHAPNEFGSSRYG